jgi:hydroxymethylbilane synthase
LQAYKVGEALQKKNVGLQINYFFRESLGDKNLTDPLWKMPEKGVFTEDFYNDLVDESTDLVVHSWKDLPTERRDQTMICATLPRADQRDLLIFKKKSQLRLESKKTLKIYSSSQRRLYNLQNFLLETLPYQPQKIQFESVRGNIPTRLQKLMTADHVDGLIVAKAAIDRLLTFQHIDFTELQMQLRKILNECDYMVLPLSENPNAAAQGAIAIEVKKGRHDIQNLLESINDSSTFEAVQKEREVLAHYGGGCHQKIGIAFLPRSYGWIQFLKGQTDQGEILNVQKLQPAQETQKLSSQKFNLAHHRDLFARKEIQYSIPAEINAVYVSRISAYREFKGLIWASGLQTWKKLAQMNVWVHGCAESLGETENPRLEALSERPLIWAKLTHKDAESTMMQSIATYQLHLKSELPLQVQNSENFFWMSVLHFDLVLKQFPQIINKVHCCGPGNTYRALTERLKPFGKKPTLFLSEKHWRQHE